MKKIKIELFLYIILVLISACKEKQDTYPLISVDSIINYSEGTVLFYVGDSIIYDNFTQQRDSVRFEYKDSLTGIDTVGQQLAYQFERYIKYPNDNSYQYLKNYTLTKGSMGVIRVLDMYNDYILPSLIGINSKWNGNQYQLGDEQIYSIQSINEDEIDILRKNDKNLISEEVSTEKYAESIGLVYKYDKRVTLDISTGEIKSGSIVILAFKP